MPDGGVRVTARVYWRNDLGRFAAAVGTGGERAVVDISKEGANVARELAPKGRTGRLAAGIHPISRGRGQGGWATPDVPEALPQEEGARPHAISPTKPHGALANREEKFFARGTVWHPGNPAIHYMQRSLSFMRSRMPSILRRNMP